MKQLITNNQNSNFFNHLTKLLATCKSFTLNVAFINYSGVQLLLNVLKGCEKRSIKGRILTSTYLNFTEVKALEKLLEFENIELKIYTEDSRGFHAKSYIFEFDDSFAIVIGSSNLTSSALKSNIEWNLKTVLKKEDAFFNEIDEEFEKLWQKSRLVDKEFLLEYQEYKSSLSYQKSFNLEESLKANFMQKEALERLNFLRGSGEKRALVIAATGSGKTYLAAFDVKFYKPTKFLFIVHRENILLKAKQSFESICKKQCLLFTGNKKAKGNFIFATIQSLSLNFKQFKEDEFDYIVIDEAHHIASPSYKKVYNYFKPKFLLGLTATPNRMDETNIYEFFDENIACDIRLNDALEENLIVPFHYYGISEIEQIDYCNIDITKVEQVAKLLMVNRRVEYIIEKLKFYGFSGIKRRALGFCISKEHAKYMSEEFNKKGLISTYLTSEDSILKREESIKKLEDDNHTLEYIFSVDIFNEGLDIPSVNTVMMLRPTNSPIVFIQQLGRGLRKSRNKEFLTLLDFIGNHNRAYQVAFYLLGNKIIDKDSVKLNILNNFANIKNAHILMDEISKQRVLAQIDKENFNSFKYLKESYLNFKQAINRRPSLIDFFNSNDLINPLDFIFHSKSYIEFVLKVEKDECLIKACQNEEFLKAIRFIESLLPIKRVYEFAILKYLIKYKTISLKELKLYLNKFLENSKDECIEHSFRFLCQEFFDSLQNQRFLKLVDSYGGGLKRSLEFEKLLKNGFYKSVLEESISYGLVLYEKSFGTEDYGLPFFKLYEKYSMLNIAQLCNFDKIHSSFRGSGFLKYKNDFFLFFTVEKDKFTKGEKYKNCFLSKDIFTYSSKPSHTQDKGDGKRLINNIVEGVNLHIFARKFAQVDKKTQAFIYLGLADTIFFKNNKPIDCQIKLRKPLSKNFYEEFTKIV